MNYRDRVIADIQRMTDLDASGLYDDVIDYTFDDQGDIIAEMLKHKGDDAYLGKYVRELYEGAVMEVIEREEKDADLDKAEYRAMVAEDARGRARDMKLEVGQ